MPTPSPIGWNRGPPPSPASRAPSRPREWQTRVPKDGRKVGVIVHHVASVYPLEIQLAQTLAGGKPVTGVTPEAVNEMNAAHAREHDAVTKEAALDLLRRNSAAAAAAIRALSDGELDQAAPVSLNADAPLTCQFMLEDHAVRHSYHHLARIRGALGGRPTQQPRPRIDVGVKCAGAISRGAAPARTRCRMPRARKSTSAARDAHAAA